MELERRAVTTAELRAEPGERPKIVGYAAVFNQLSEDLGGFVEVIRPGAFKRALAEGADVRALWNHDPNHVLGRTTAGTLRLVEDDYGLRFEADPPDTQWARDLLESIRRGDVTGTSFAFRAREDRWGTQDGQPLRELHDVDLFDVGPVTFPAYRTTTVAVRAREQAERLAHPRLTLLRRRLELAGR